LVEGEEGNSLGTMVVSLPGSCTHEGLEQNRAGPQGKEPLPGGASLYSPCCFGPS
jgi:hypothetical protein